jgi:hypothetical protein
MLVLQMAEQLLSVVWTVLTAHDMFNRREKNLILPPSTPPNVDTTEMEDTAQEDMPDVVELEPTRSTKQEGDASLLVLDDKSKTTSSTVVAPTTTPELSLSHTTNVSHTLLLASVQKAPAQVRNNIFKMPATTTARTPTYPGGIKAYYQAKIESAEMTINERTQNLRRLEAQRNALNARGTHYSSYPLYRFKYDMYCSKNANYIQFVVL